MRGRDVSLMQGAAPSDAATVANAISLAGKELNEAMMIQPALGNGVLYDGAELQGTVKLFHPGTEGKGYGFINVAGDTTDLYFQTRDLRPADQEKVVSEGFNLQGADVWFWLEMLDGGRTGKWRAHDVSLSSEGGKRPADFGEDGSPAAKRARVTGPDMSAFAAMATSGQRHPGTVKSYNKSFGFISSTGLPEDVFFLKSELPAGTDDAGVVPGLAVDFELIIQEGGKFRAKGISFPATA